MLLTCPHCSFSREIDGARIPATARRATCPRCGQRFVLAETELQAPATTLPKAGFWIRVVASMIDSAILGTVQLIMSLALARVALGVAGSNTPEIDQAIGIITALLGLVLSITYAVFFIGYCGQTPGKMVLRIKVIRTDQHEVGYLRALLRETAGKFLSGIIFGIGYLMVAFDSQKQGLHDKIADTYVIKL